MVIMVEIPVLPLNNINNIYGDVVTMNSDLVFRGQEHTLLKKYCI